ncbi:MAG: KOW domain-containing RNA-binding protein [Clostridiales bacterium]|nr:KOW domain-containing RNA-binding protein [Clostridiales bacterium]
MDAKPAEGGIVVSLKGHDTGRLYYVASVINQDFILLVDGRYRKIDNPKQKRIGHVRQLAAAPLGQDGFTDPAVRALIKSYQNKR